MEDVGWYGVGLGGGVGLGVVPTHKRNIILLKGVIQKLLWHNISLFRLSTLLVDIVEGLSFILWGV